MLVCQATPRPWWRLGFCLFHTHSVSFSSLLLHFNSVIWVFGVGVSLDSAWLAETMSKMNGNSWRCHWWCKVADYSLPYLHVSCTSLCVFLLVSINWPYKWPGLNFIQKLRSLMLLCLYTLCCELMSYTNKIAECKLLLLIIVLDVMVELYFLSLQNS